MCLKGEKQPNKHPNTKLQWAMQLKVTYTFKKGEGVMEYRFQRTSSKTKSKVKTQSINQISKLQVKAAQQNKV